MAVEIREIVLQARIIDDREETLRARAAPADEPDFEDMRRAQMAECEQLIRRTLARRRER